MEQRKINIRPACEKDIPDILRLLVQVCNVHHAIRPDLFIKDGTKYSADELKEIIKNDMTPVFTAVNGKGETVGYAFCELKEKGNSGAAKRYRTLYIDDICVDESARGQHIGKALFEAVRAFAVSEGCYDITLNVWTGNDSAYRFYEAMEMKPLKTEMELML